MVAEALDEDLGRILKGWEAELGQTSRWPTVDNRNSSSRIGIGIADAVGKLKLRDVAAVFVKTEQGVELNRKHQPLHS